MPTRPLSPPLLSIVAERFRVLGEPARLRILRDLQEGERTVTELVDETGLTQANVSKHLQLLHTAGFVVRRKEGLRVFYRLADTRVFKLCDIMCDAAAAELARRTKVFAAR